MSDFWKETTLELDAETRVLAEKLGDELTRALTVEPLWVVRLHDELAAIRAELALPTWEARLKQNLATVVEGAEMMLKSQGAILSSYETVLDRLAAASELQCRTFGDLTEKMAELSAAAQLQRELLERFGTDLASVRQILQQQVVVLEHLSRPWYRRLFRRL